METRRRQGRSQTEAEETRKLLQKSKDNESDFQSYSTSSSNEEGDDISEYSDDGFVVQGQYADDFVPEKKKTANSKNKEKEQVQKTTLFSLLAKQSGTATKKSVAKPTIKEQKNDDDDLASILQQMNVDDDDDPRKKKRKNKQKAVASVVPAFLNKQKDIERDDDENDFEPPPPPPPSTLPEQQIETDSNNKIDENISSNASQLEKNSTENNAKSKKKNAERLANFELQQVTMENLELTEEEIKLFQKFEIDVPSDETMDLYMFHVHEENGNLYLFCKYKHKGKYVTVCIMIGQCFYNLQFLPIPGHEDELIEEVNQITRKAQFTLIRDKSKYKDRRYAFDKLNVPSFSKWYCVQLNPKGDLSKIPTEGDHYSEVFGLTSSLTERFLLKKHIYGPTWIRVTEVKKLKQYTTCPMFSIKDIKSVQVLPENQQPDEHVPPFNVCTFALQKVIDSKNNPQIVMAAMDILYYWNIESFTPSRAGDKKSRKSMIFVCPKKNESLSSEYVKSVKPGSNVIICENETKLLERFVDEIEKYDIDLISSFGLNSVDIPLIYEKLIQHKIKKWHLLGRMNRVEPKKGKFDLLLILAGRLPVDVRVSCMEFLKSKVNDFSAIVKDNFAVERQNVENLDISKKMSSPEDLKNLINFTLRDSQLVTRLLRKIEVLSLTLQISKLSACPWSRVLLGASSPRCETLLLQNFSEAKYVLPEKVFLNKNEGMKRESKYKGGMVLDPIRGFYDTCILVLDFNSLYPSIIREFNICFTTVDKENPDAYKSKNSKTNGIVPRIMKDLLEARNKIKVERAQLQKEANTLKEGTPKFENVQLNIGRLNIKEKAIKLLANSIYGYLAYKGSRFQSQQLAALITQQGRTILDDTVKTMINMCGSESAVIYGDTDSVMVNSSVTEIALAKKKAEELSNAISKKYKYLKLGIDYIFLKMLLVQKKKYAALVYHDPPETPQLKRSGLDMVRRDWSTLTRNMSEFIINQFMKDKQEKDQAISNILNELEAVSAIMHNNGKPLEDDEDKGEEKPKSIVYPKGIPITHLLINKALKNKIESYQNSSKNPPHVAVALRMKEQGIPKSQGDTISYYIIKSDSRDIGSKARFKEEVKDDFSLIDVDWYLTNQLLHPLWRLCEPFGSMQLSQIASALGCHMQIALDNLTTDNESSPVYNIPRLCELTYICRGCNQPVRMTTKYSECLTCPRNDCGFRNNWKDVANQLTLFVRNFVIDPRMKESESPKIYGCDGYLCTYKSVQLPLSTKKPMHTNGYKSNDNELCHGGIVTLVSPADTFNTLRYFKALFDKQKAAEDPEMDEFRDYMSRTLNSIYQTHEFTRVNFRQIFNQEKP